MSQSTSLDNRGADAPIRSLRLLLVEDQTIIRHALAALLKMEKDFVIAGDCSNGEQAKNWIKTEAAVDLVITDIQMPVCDGLMLCEWMKIHSPKTPVLVLTTFARTGYLVRALRAGAKGFLLKDAEAGELAEAIRMLARGRQVIDSQLALSALSQDDPLNDKERQALALAHSGLSSRDIAKRLFLSEGTVRNYLSEAINKLGATNRIDAAQRAFDQGWL
jgi:two-component system, NarL family, response regulator DesR